VQAEQLGATRWLPPLLASASRIHSIFLRLASRV
jgi:hypothetical protein